jgi:hypothetical protein
MHRATSSSICEAPVEAEPIESALRFKGIETCGTARRFGRISLGPVSLEALTTGDTFDLASIPDAADSLGLGGKSPANEATQPRVATTDETMQAVRL